MNNKFLASLFEELKRLNKTPKFQLERAISPLLGIFIKEIVSKSFTVNISTAIPEFPIKKGLNRQSTNIDWLLVDKESETFYCVELKTDKNSFDKKQFNSYEVLKDNLSKPEYSLFSDIETIKEFSNRSDKYQDLLDFIEDDLGLLKTIKNLEIIYIIPSSLQSQLPDGIKKITLNNLPDNIETEFPNEWEQLNSFLKSIDR